MAPLATEKVEVSDKGRSLSIDTAKNGPADSGPNEDTSADHAVHQLRRAITKNSGVSVVAAVRRYAPGSTPQILTSANPARSHINRSSRGVKHVVHRSTSAASPHSLRTSVRS